jgi:hypothetical protein
MNAKLAATVLGAVFIVVGILGFIPNPLVSADGLFAVNAAHNLIHLATGAVLLAGAYSGLGASLALKIIGVVYALVAVLGFVLVGDDDMLLGFIHVNGADKALHVLLAAVILAAGFGLPDDRSETARA